MTRCLLAPSLYLEQGWLLFLIIYIMWHLPESKFQITIVYNGFENYTLKIIATYPGGQWVKMTIYIYQGPTRQAYSLLCRGQVEKVLFNKSIES